VAAAALLADALDPDPEAADLRAIRRGHGNRAGPDLAPLQSVTHDSSPIWAPRTEPDVAPTTDAATVIMLACSVIGGCRRIAQSTTHLSGN
jgi:hypothetical protein